MTAVWRTRTALVVVRGLERAGIDQQLFAWLQPIGVAIRFLDYLRVGLPVTVVTLVFGIWWLS
jgi:Na+/H+ antiporter NhaD/arsenite permease-like protein